MNVSKFSIKQIIQPSEKCCKNCRFKRMHGKDSWTLCEHPYFDGEYLYVNVNQVCDFFLNTKMKLMNNRN